MTLDCRGFRHSSRTHQHSFTWSDPLMSFGRSDVGRFQLDGECSSRINPRTSSQHVYLHQVNSLKCMQLLSFMDYSGVVLMTVWLHLFSHSVTSWYFHSLTLCFLPHEWKWIHSHCVVRRSITVVCDRIKVSKVFVLKHNKQTDIFRKDLRQWSRFMIKFLYVFQQMSYCSARNTLCTI